MKYVSVCPSVNYTFSVYLCEHRIDANVDEAEMSVEAAHTELVKYFQSVTSNRWLMIKIFAVLIIFFIIFVIVVV